MPKSQRVFDDNGFVTILDNPISCAGVYPYKAGMIKAPDWENNPDKIIYVLRPPEELSKKQTLDSLKLMPFVDDHAMLSAKDDDDREDPDDYGVRGTTGEQIYFDYKDDSIKSNLKIYSKKVIKNSDKHGKKQLSVGYDADHEFTAGVWRGKHYDAIQRNLTGNHLAVVYAGRMGGNVAIMDSHDIDFNQLKPEGGKMNEHLEAIKKALEFAEQMEKLAPMLHQALASFVKEEEGEPENTESESAVEGFEDDKTGIEGEHNEDEVKDESLETKKPDFAPETNAKDEDKKQPIMDAADIQKAMRKELSSIAKEFAAKEALVSQAQKTGKVGVFDHADLSIEETADYIAKKLSLSPRKGQALSVIEGYLAGQKSASKAAVTDGADAAQSFASKAKATVCKYAKFSH